MKTIRKFGLELETVGLNHRGLERALNNGGIRAQAEDYNHAARSYWKIVQDGSLRAQGEGSGEVVSPPMFSIDEVRKACRALVAGGATVNRSCGLHVHMDAHDIGDGDNGILDWKVLVSSYIAAETEIDSVMPLSRRGNRNQYCKSMVNSTAVTAASKAAQIDRVWQARSLSEMVDVYRGDRYWKVNLCPFVRQGTVEFRQHAGTLNADKVANWVLALETMMNHARRAATAVREGRASEEEVKRKLRDGLWYTGGSMERMMAVLAPSYPHAQAAADAAAAARNAISGAQPDSVNVAEAVDAVLGPDWRSSLDVANFRPVRMTTRSGPDAPRARAVQIMNANPTLPWADLIGMITDQTGMTPGNANMVFARWNKRLRERELNARPAPRARTPRATATAIEAPAPEWREISEFYQERSMELSEAVS